MQCSDCGTWVGDAAAFCNTCGALLSDGESAPQLGHYQLLEKIGEGGIGAVYLAFDAENSREVAFKVLHRNLLQDKDHLTRFRREAYLQSRLDHPNTVRLLSVYEDGRNLGLVMELLRGCELKAYLRHRGVLSGAEIHYLAGAILSGLEAAHEEGIVHRDLKPSNVFLTDDGGVKIMDFGTAKLQSVRSELTKAGGAIGSYYYMAPEQIAGGEVDGRTDLYAFGMILYQLATGKLPFTGKTGGAFEIMEKQVRQLPESPDQINPDIPAVLTSVIMTLLEKNSEDRFASCASVRQALSGLGEMQPIWPVEKHGKRSPFSALNHQRSSTSQDGLSTTGEKARNTVSGVEKKAEPGTLLWTFREATPVAPDVPPLNLRTPPPIERNILMRLRQTISAIPPLPGIWHEVQSFYDNPEASPHSLTCLLQKDALLADAILQAAGALSHAGSTGVRPDDVALAIMQLGMDSVYDLLIRDLVARVVPGDASTTTALRHLWFKAEMTARFSRTLAEYSSVVDRYAVTLFGMLHDIGKLVILHMEPEERLAALKAEIKSGVPGLKAEWDTLGYTHIDAGMMLAMHWQLPRSVQRFIYFHHHPAWYRPEIWPTDMQAPAMLVHTAHLLLQEILAGEEEDASIWMADRRSRVAASEPLLRQPLRLPLDDAAFYARMQQDFMQVRRGFPDIFAHAGAI